MDAETGETMFACLLVAPYLLVIPWGYAWRTFVNAPADRASLALERLP